MTTQKRFSTDDLRDLLNGGVGESQHLELKQEFTLESDEAKRKLARHVAAMANAGGGTLLIGINDQGELHKRDVADGFSEQVVQGINSQTDPALDVRVELHEIDGHEIHSITVPNRAARPVAVSSRNVTHGWIVPIRRSQTIDYLTFTEATERIAAGQGTRLRLNASAQRLRVALRHAVEQLADSTYANNEASESARARFRQASNRVREAIEALVFEIHLIPDTDFTQPISQIKHEVLRAFDYAARDLEQIERNIDAPVSAIRWDPSQVRSSWESPRRDVDTAIETLDTATRTVFGPDE